jgi:hypothetical protein
MQPTKHVALAATLLALAGCNDQSSGVDQSKNLLDPVALDSELMFVDTTSHQALLLDGSGKSPSAKPKAVLDLPVGPISATRRLGKHDEALVLCTGERSSAQSDAQPAALSLIDHDGNVRNFDLGTTPFDTLVQSDDGDYAVLFRSKNDEGLLLNNANELAVVDLNGKTGTSAVKHKTPQSFGHTPTGAVFSPAMQIAMEERRLLVVLSAAEVTLIDLNHLDRRETIVQLGDAGRTVSPVQVLFSKSDPTLYVRGAASNDIFVFRLEQYMNDPKGNDFRPSINQLGGGTGPADITLFNEATDPRLLVAAQASAQAIVVDPSSSKATNVHLSGSANRILLFTATAPHSMEKQERALLYSLGSSSVAFLDLVDVESRKERNLETVTLDQPIGGIIPLLAEGKVVVLNSSNGVSVLDLAERTIAPISSSSALTGALFDKDKKSLWVAPPGQPRVGTLNLTTGATDEVLLDQNVRQVLPLFGAKRVAIVHDSEIGYVTFLDSLAPSRQSAVSVRGFWIADILDRGEK